MKNKFNVWRFKPENNIDHTAGWEYFVTITAFSEEIAESIVSQKYEFPLGRVKAYPHIDNAEGK